MQPNKLIQNNFNEAYKKLNEQQREAVDAIEGPVMVIAGPGTGKTEIIAIRITKTLLETDTLPQNILCLTYTDAGTIAMRKRLLQFMGTDACKVNIYTFDAFCVDVIQDNLWLLNKIAVDPISQLEHIQLFKNLIDGFKKDHPLKRYRGDVYFYIRHLKELFTFMKQEGWSAKSIEQKIDAYLTDLPLWDEYLAKQTGTQFIKGSLRTDKIAIEVEKMNKFRAAVKEFDNYQNLLQATNRYDFGDRINWVTDLFENNISLLTDYQEKFQYILVDEYQDTSGTQNKLIQLLTNVQIKPNLFVVGDDDQSIFRFQGASVENMLNFISQYRNNLTTVVLTKNYRSIQPVLDIATTLINKNNNRLVKQTAGLSKTLTAANLQIKELSIKPVFYEYNTVKEEMVAITNAVDTLLKQKISPADIAVIYKENEYGSELATYFTVKNIPFYSKKNINILEQPFVIKLLQLLRYLHAEQDTPFGGEQLLFEILHYDFYNIPPIEIAKLTVEVNSKKYSGEPVSLRKLLYDKANLPPKFLFENGINEHLKKISGVIENLIRDVSNTTLHELFQHIITNSGVLTYLINSNEKMWLMQLLTALTDFIKEETSRNPYLKLKDFVATTDLMIQEKLPLPLVKLSGNDMGVNLLTAHGSKGLGFKHVFIAGLNAASWENQRKPGGGFKIPDTLFSSALKTTAEEELRRLFYVAITRTEIYLTISYAKFNNDGKEMEPSMFITGIVEQHNLPIQKIHLPDEQMFEFEQLYFTDKAPEIEKVNDDFITPLLNKFVMNVSALNTYLHCPLEFYYKNILRIPAGKSDTLTFGSAVHYALEKLFRKMQDGKQNKFASVKEMMEDFSWFMHRNRAYFTEESFERRMEQGTIIIPPYYETYQNSWNKVVAIERNISGVNINGVPLKGKVDKLEFNGKEINVVDYKTGDIDKALSKMKPPEEGDPNGGDYWRQAVFYKILIDNYTQKDWKVVSTEFDFVEPDKNKIYRKVRIIITPADIETVKHQIVQVWGKIQNREFFTGCGKKDCQWCNFVKNNKLAKA